MARARELFQHGQTSAAADIILAQLSQEPTHVEALLLAAELAAAQSDKERAITLYTSVIGLRPDDPAAYYKRGNLLRDTDKFAAALNDYDRAIALDSAHANAYCNRGVVLERLSRPTDARASYDQAIALNPEDALAYYNRAGIHRALSEPESALADYGRAVAIRPIFPEAECNRALLLTELKRMDEALASYRLCIDHSPGFYAAHFHLGALLQRLGGWQASLESYDEAIKIQPTSSEAFCNRGVVLTELGRWNDAVASYSQAISLKPDLAEAFAGLAFCLLGLGLINDAVAAYDRSLALDPDGKYVLGMRRHALMHMCNWDEMAKDCASIASGVRAGRPVALPFTLLSLTDSPELQRLAAETWVREECPADASLGAVPRRARAEKIKVGYFSADFRAHPVALLTAELFETHDRAKFNVTGFAFGPEAEDSVRTRLRGAFDQFINVRQHTDREVALLAREMGIDIAVDLGGFTHYSRTKIFAQRAAPIQLSYIGYLGTLAAPYMDYLVADPTLIPPAQRGAYGEKIIYLPSYQANDSYRPRPEPRFSRIELGLPATGFVYCCFNANYKITPTVFAQWMRILARSPGSCLFLYIDNPMAQSNLKREAMRSGVDEQRIVFAERVPLDAYLARLHAMDLFLDTTPYNAGTTASDALWMGLPVLTCAGHAFASRMAASLLTALGLTELISPTPAEYEETAVTLAMEPARMDLIRRKLADARATTRLFNTPAFVQSLEDAYEQIYERHHAHLAPDHIYPRL